MQNRSTPEGYGDRLLKIRQERSEENEVVMVCQAKRKKWFKEKGPTRSKADGCLSMMRLKKHLLNLVIWRTSVTLTKS